MARDVVHVDGCTSFVLPEYEDGDNGDLNLEDNGVRFDASKQIWFPMEIRGVLGYFADIRINRDTVPGWFRFWELADGDSDGEPCRYRNGIAVNFYGTFLTVGELPIDDKEWAEGYIADGEWEIAWDRSLSFGAMIKIELERSK